MTLKRKIVITLGSFLGLGLLLFALLIVHIAVVVKNRKPLENATIQMTRADFKQPVGMAAIEKIQKQIMALPGVKDTYFEPGSNILIYTFDGTRNNARNIYNTAIKNSGFRSEIHVFTKEEESKGCPAINNHSFYGKLTTMVERVIK